jgi:adenosylcobinamide-GDP ribazoletransferase
MRSFLVALSLLTVWPVRFDTVPTADDVARTRHWFPFVGLLLGGFLGGMTFLATALSMPPLLGAFVILLTWVVSTGALHLDGLCDLCDGLFGGTTPERRLEIMKDPHVGTFGMVGGMLLLLGKFACLAELLRSQAEQAPWWLATAVLLARALVLMVAVGCRYPREDGTGRAIIEAVTMRDAMASVCWAGVLAALPAITGLVASVPLMASMIFALVAALSLRAICRRRLGGVTGDCLGAAIELVELVVLISVVAVTAPPSAR